MNSVLAPLRCIGLGMLCGLIWKWHFFRFADEVYSSTPIVDDFFPALLRDADVLRWGYLATLASVTAVTAMPLANHSARMHRIRMVAATTGLLGSTILLCHQGSYNDVTFVTVWWCAVFTLWYTSRISADEPGALIAKASHLSRVVISLVFLGGAVGKWTSEYWSGQVLYEIYFVDRDFWSFRWLRDRLDGDSLRTLSTGYSRFVIVVESAGGLIWAAGYFVRSRTLAVVATIAFAAIGLLSNFLLFSVLAPMMGLAMVGWFDRSTKSRKGIDPT